MGRAEEREKCRRGKGEEEKIVLFILSYILPTFNYYNHHIIPEHSTVGQRRSHNSDPMPTSVSHYKQRRAII